MNLVLLEVPALEGKLRRQLAPIKIASRDHRRDGAAFAMTDCVNRRVIDCLSVCHPILEVRRKIDCGRPGLVFLLTVGRHGSDSVPSVCRRR